MVPEKSTFAFLSSDVPVPFKQLVRFKRVTVPAGEARTVELNVAAEHWGLVDGEGDRKLQPGKYKLLVTRGHGKTLEADLQVSAPAPVMIQKFRHKWW